MSPESDDQITFIQLLPNFQRIILKFEQPPEVIAMAKRLTLHGYEFIAEISNGEVRLTIYDPTTGIIPTQDLVENGPKVKKAVEELITKFYNSIFGAPQPEDYE